MAGNSAGHITSKGNANMTKQTTLTIELARSNLAKADRNNRKAAQDYQVLVGIKFKDIPDDQLASFSGNLKDIPAGSHHATMQEERELLVGKFDKAGSGRQAFNRALAAILKERGVEKAAKNANRGKSKAEAGEADRVDTGYTREKVIATITQLAAWVRDNEAPDFNVNETMKGLQLALSGLNKVNIAK